MSSRKCGDQVILNVLFEEVKTTFLSDTNILVYKKLLTRNSTVRSLKTEETPVLGYNYSRNYLF